MLSCFMGDKIFLLRIRTPAAWLKREDAPAWSHIKPHVHFGSAAIVWVAGRLGRLYWERLVERFRLSRPKPAKPSPYGYKKERRLTAFRQAWAAIPDTARAAILSAGYPDRHWHVWSMVARCDGALDLVGNNAPLAYCLASGNAFRGKERVERPLRSVRRLLRRPQTESLRWLSMPPTRSARDVLRKAKGHDLRDFFTLRSLLWRPESMKIMAHLPALSRGVTRVLADDLAPFVGHGLLLDLANRPAENPFDVARLMHDTLLMAEAQRPGLVHPGNPNRLCFRSWAGLQAVHDELAERLARRGDPALSRLVMPPWPYALPSPTHELRVRHLDTGADFFALSRRLHNCLSSYPRRVWEAAGRWHVFSVEAPEEAGLLIEIADDGEPFIVEARKACNLPIGSATEMKIASWLYHCKQQAWEDGARCEP
jgi:hypothetical protein